MPTQTGREQGAVTDYVEKGKAGEAMVGRERGITLPG